jgi:hypothetical protein
MKSLVFFFFSTHKSREQHSRSAAAPERSYTGDGARTRPRRRRSRTLYTEPWSTPCPQRCPPHVADRMHRPRVAMRPPPHARSLIMPCAISYSESPRALPLNDSYAHARVRVSRSEFCGSPRLCTSAAACSAQQVNASSTEFWHGRVHWLSAQHGRSLLRRVQVRTSQEPSGTRSGSRTSTGGKAQSSCCCKGGCSSSYLSVHSEGSSSAA